MAAPLPPRRIRASQTTQRLMHWLVLAAFVLSTFAPVLAAVRGDASDSRTMLASFCHADGSGVSTIEIPLDGDDDEAATSAGGFCLLCVYPTLLPGWSMPGAQSDARPLILAAVATAPPRLADLWHPARARAPPAQT